jgi:two-component sensor histidine kinase
MILNELLTNVFKYAFPDDRRGSVFVNLTAKEKVLSMIVHDTGVGMPQEIDTETPQAFGLQLVRNLAKQLGGEVSFDGGSGTTVTVVVPFAEEAKGEQL